MSFFAGIPSTQPSTRTSKLIRSGGASATYRYWVWNDVTKQFVEGAENIRNVASLSKAQEALSEILNNELSPTQLAQDVPVGLSHGLKNKKANVYVYEFRKGQLSDILNQADKGNAPRSTAEEIKKTLSAIYHPSSEVTSIQNATSLAETEVQAASDSLSEDQTKTNALAVLTAVENAVQPVIQVTQQVSNGPNDVAADSKTIEIKLSTIADVKAEIAQAPPGPLSSANENKVAEIVQSTQAALAQQSQAAEQGGILFATYIKIKDLWSLKSLNDTKAANALQAAGYAYTSNNIVATAATYVDSTDNTIHLYIYDVVDNDLEPLLENKAYSRDKWDGVTTIAAAEKDVRRILASEEKPASEKKGPLKRYYAFFSEATDGSLWDDLNLPNDIKTQQEANDEALAIIESDGYEPSDGELLAIARRTSNTGDYLVSFFRVGESLPTDTFTDANDKAILIPFKTAKGLLVPIDSDDILALFISQSLKSKPKQNKVPGVKKSVFRYYTGKNGKKWLSFAKSQGESVAFTKNYIATAAEDLISKHLLEDGSPKHVAIAEVKTIEPRVVLIHFFTIPKKNSDILVVDGTPVEVTLAKESKFGVKQIQIEGDKFYKNKTTTTEKPSNGQSLAKVAENLTKVALNKEKDADVKTPAVKKPKKPAATESKKPKKSKPNPQRKSTIAEVREHETPKQTKTLDQLEVPIRRFHRELSAIVISHTSV